MFNKNIKIINKELLPNEIDYIKFQGIYQKIKGFICDFFELKSDFNDIIFEISPETPSEKHVGFDFNDIKNEIIQELEDKKKEIDEDIIKYIDDKINEVMQCQSKKELYHMASSLAEYLAKYGENIDYEYSYEGIRKRLEDMIGKISFEEDTLGIYSYDSYWDKNESIVNNQKIILYINNIIKNKESYDGIENAIEAVMSHEMFHFFHHEEKRKPKTKTEYSIDYEFEQRKDYFSDVLIESLASYFEYTYCKTNGIKNDVDESWEYNSIFMYPYSGAKYIKKSDSYFKKLTWCSVLFFDLCMSVLLNDDKKLYYKLKNKEIIHKTKAILPLYSIIHESKHRDVINKLLNEKIKFFAKSTWPLKGLYQEGLLWFIRIDGKNRNGFVNSFNNKDVIEKSDTYHEVYKEKYRYIFDVIGDGENRIYLYIGKFEYDKSKSDNYISYFKSLEYSDIYVDSYLKFKIINFKLLEFITSDVKLDLPKKTIEINNYSELNTNLHKFISVDYDDSKEEFIDMLERLMHEKGYNQYSLSDEVCVERKAINQILNHKKQRHPQKSNLIKICIGLRLALEDGIELLRKAGYSLNDEYLDRLVYKCLKDNIYDKDEIDATLVYMGYDSLFRKDNYE